MSKERARVRRLTGGCGAEVLGVDIGGDLDDAEWQTMQDAFREHGVIFFRDQQLSPGGHIAFARRWGAIDINRFIKPHDDHPEITLINKGEFDTANVGGEWHTDHSYDEVPAMCSILVARALPDEGGDTLFASMHNAYLTLSPGLQNTLQGLNAVHSAAHVFGPGGRANRERSLEAQTQRAEVAGGDVSHPVVIAHPETGRPCLYVNPIFTLRIDGWTPEESRPLLEFLYRHAAKPETTCRFRWAPGSVAMWDNRATWHYAANDYHGHRRLMHRITVAGSRLSPYRTSATAAAA